MTKYIRTHGKQVRGFATVALALAVALGFALAFAVGAGVFADQPTATIEAIEINDNFGHTYQGPDFPDFDCDVNPLFGEITVSGSGSATNPQGHESQYATKIDWGDGTVENVTTNFDPNDPDWGGDFTFDFSGSHTYGSNGQNSITITFFHQTSEGRDNTDAQAIISNVCQEPANPGSVTVTKIVDGGDAQVSDFPLFVGNTSVTSGEPNLFTPGDYVISETNDQDGYTGVIGGEDCDANGNLAVESDGVYTCTITNTFQAPNTSTVTICKYDDSQNPLSGWEVSLSGDSDFGGTTGDNGCVEISDVPFDDYTLAEVVQPGWVYVSGNAGAVVVGTTTETFNLVNRELAECEDGIDNDDDGFIDHSSLNQENPDINCDSPGDDNESANPKLTVIKEVLGSDLAPSSFTLTITPPNGSPFNQAGEGAPGQDNTFSATGTYSVVENDSQGAEVAYSVDCSGEIGLNEHKTCTVTNRFPTGGGDQFGSLTLVKEVVNDNEGNATNTDWTLSASGPSNISGPSGDSAVTGAQVLVGSYDLSESGPSGYSASNWVCVLEEGEVEQTDGDTVVIAEGDDVTCTITNNDNEPSSGGGGGGGGTSSRRDTSGGSEPEGEVLGEQVAVLPAGAPNTGFGGTATQTAAGTTLAGTLSLLLGFFGLTLATKQI